MSALAHEGAKSPFTDAEVGKVKRVSKDKLPPTIKRMVEEDIEGNRNPNKRGIPHEVVPEDAFIFADNYQNRLRSEERIRPHLKVQPADLSKSKLADYEFQGFIADGPETATSHSVVRAFKRPDGVLITLSEFDFVSAGGGVLAVDELMNVKVKNQPARLVVKKAPSGRSMSELTWVDKRKAYTLTVLDEVTEPQEGAYDKPWLLELAERLK